MSTKKTGCKRTITFGDGVCADGRVEICPVISVTGPFDRDFARLFSSYANTLIRELAYSELFILLPAPDQEVPE